MVMPFLSGRFYINLGLKVLFVVYQPLNGSILLDVKSQSEKLLPEYMKDAGYDTHLFGKWHLGFCDERFRPNNRGFDTSYGILGSGCDYTTHKSALSNTYDYWTASGKSYNTVDRNYDAYTTDDFVAQ